jgi:hypothetical protein
MIERFPVSVMSMRGVTLFVTNYLLLWNSSAFDHSRTTMLMAKKQPSTASAIDANHPRRIRKYFLCFVCPRDTFQKSNIVDLVPWSFWTGRFNQKTWDGIMWVPDTCLRRKCWIIVSGWATLPDARNFTNHPLPKINHSPVVQLSSLKCLW